METNLAYFKCLMLVVLYVYSVYLKDWRECENNFEISNDKTALSKMIDRMMFSQIAADARRKDELRYKEQLEKRRQDKGKLSDDDDNDIYGEEESEDEMPMPEKIEHPKEY